MFVKKTTGLNIALVVLGFATILIQLVFIREFLNIFEGNELIIGLVLCTWMLLTAAGSRLGNWINKGSVHIRLIYWLFILQGCLPILIIFLLYFFEAQLFEPGTAKGLGVAFGFCLALLLPCCLLAGMLFTMLNKLISDQYGENSLSSSYGWESSGSVFAGLLFSLGLAYVLNTFQVLAIVLMVNLLLLFFLFGKADLAWNQLIIPVFIFVAAIFVLVSPFNYWIKAMHYKYQELLYTKDTPYGNISLTRTSGQYNVYENGALFFSTQNYQQSEEAVHFALLQHPEPHRVMIVSGGLTGMVGEVLKYQSVESVEYIEINPWLVKAEGLFADSVISSKVNIINSDARRWIGKSLSVYDAILVISPDPLNAHINRYFTLQFFQEIHRALKPNGIFEISVSPAVNYMSEESVEINSMIYATLKRVFNDVKIIPGGKNYFVASDGVIELDIANRSKLSGLKNEFINPYFIEDDLLKQQNGTIMEQISTVDPSINTDLMPVAYFIQIKHWLKKHEGKQVNLSILVLCLFIVSITLFLLYKGISTVNIGIFAVAYAGASSEFLLLIIFQVLFGYVYQMIGLIIGFYMAGLAVGSLIGISSEKKILIRNYLLLQFVLLILVIIIPVFAVVSLRYEFIPDWVIQILLYSIMFAVAFVSGLEFNICSKMDLPDAQRRTDKLYGIDLAGAALGALITSLVCFPLLGLLITCMIIAMLLLFSVIMFRFRSA